MSPWRPSSPSLAFTDIALALPVARALCAGGLRVLEISLRTAVGLACIEAIRKGLPDAIVGAGGLTRAVDFAAADRAGAQFGATPGLTPELAAASRGARFPVMPGVMSPTEVIGARNSSFTVLKLFPAEQAGGVSILRAFAHIFPDCCSAPAAGSRGQTPRTICRWQMSHALREAGWFRKLCSQGDWPGIEALARDATSLAKS